MNKTALIVKKRGGGERVIPPHKWWIDKNTPIGEDADYYEIMSHGGKRWIDRRTIIRKEEYREKCPFPWTGDDGTVEQCIANDHCGCVHGKHDD